jgi:5-carboxymethyl-2-hydroxymuconate isomerase
MPHIILEHSANIVEKSDFKGVLKRLHDTMMEFGVFSLNDIKSRVYAVNNFYIADGSPNHAFVHLEVGILSGRNLEMREKLSEKMIGILKEEFQDSLHERHCIVSLELRELDRETYRKVISAHASTSGM